jgi:hypothetical protein
MKKALLVIAFLILAGMSMAAVTQPAVAPAATDKVKYSAPEILTGKEIVLMALSDWDVSYSNPSTGSYAISALSATRYSANATGVAQALSAIARYFWDIPNNTARGSVIVYATIGTTGRITLVRCDAWNEGTATATITMLRGKTYRELAGRIACTYANLRFTPPRTSTGAATTLRFRNTFRFSP